MFNLNIVREKIKNFFGNESNFIIKINLSKSYSIFFCLLGLLSIIVKNNTLNWIIMTIACFGIIGNDSIQIIGTFLASSKSKKKIFDYIFIISVFALTIICAYIFYNGRVDFNILERIPFRQINIYYVIAPIILLLLTNNGVPTSSTFLILSMFVDNDNVKNMLSKTIISYFGSFVFSGYVWYIILKYFKKYIMEYDKENINNTFYFVQALCTVLLIISWLFFSLANITVFLPRVLNLYEIILFLVILITILSIILFDDKKRKMQYIITDKKDSSNIIVNIIISLMFTFILLFCKHVSNTSIATVFVFLGILAGKEVAFTVSNTYVLERKYRRTLFVILKDVDRAVFGIIISLTFIKIVNFLNIL